MDVLRIMKSWAVLEMRVSYVNIFNKSKLNT